jgi:hypothetical protein
MSNRFINILAFAVLTLLWLGFGIALLFNPELLQVVWLAFRSWPLVGQLLITLLTLPVVIGLWVWQTTWPIWLRLILVIGLAWTTLYTFFPKTAARQPDGLPSSS